MDKFVQYIKTSLANVRDCTGSYTRSDIYGNRLLALVSYLWIGCLVPKFLLKGSRYAAFHADQGLTLAAFGTVITLVLKLLGKIPVIGIIFRLLRVIVIIACLLLSLVGILNCLNGKAKELPFIGVFRITK